MNEIYILGPNGVIGNGAGGFHKKLPDDCNWVFCNGEWVEAWFSPVQNWSKAVEYCILDIDGKGCYSHIIGTFGKGRKYRRGKNRCKHCGYKIGGTNEAL